MCGLTVTLIKYVTKLASEDVVVYLSQFFQLIAGDCNCSAPRLAEISYSFVVRTEVDDLMMQHTQFMMENTRTSIN
jgi:hypothetical protein